MHAHMLDWRRLRSVLLLSFVTAQPVAGDIFRWDNGERIPGTEGISPNAGVDLRRYDLRYADLRGFDLRRAQFDESVLWRANLTGSRLADVSLAFLEGANLNGVRMANANLTGADLTGARLAWATFTKASLRDATLAGTILFHVSFAQADLTGTNLKNADLSESLLNGTTFTRDTVYDQWTKFPVNFDPVAAGLTFERSPLGDFNGNGTIEARDADLLMSKIRSFATVGGQPQYDLDNNQEYDHGDVQFWVTAVARTWFGDVDLDGQFNSRDLVITLTAGEYEDSVADNSRWSSGDWNGDRDFSSADLVLAFADGGYENGRRAAIRLVPEPVGLSWWMMLLGLAWRARPHLMRMSEQAHTDPVYSRTLPVICFRTAP